MEATAQEVIANWVNGNREDALAQLEEGGAALTAHVFVTGFDEGHLRHIDLHVIAGGLLRRQVDRNEEALRA